VTDLAGDGVGTGDGVERSETWNGLRAGDPVVVAGVPWRRAAWTFRAHVVNRRNGTESVEVVGGRPGDRSVRSFDPGRIYAVRGRPARSTRTASGRPARSGVPSVARATSGAASLADAPQLPLG
jgi:hypothetical protein